MNSTRTLSTFAAALCLLTLQASPSQACWAAPVPHELDETEQALDTTPPGAVEILEVDVSRGRGPDCSGTGGYSETSLDDLGSIMITLKPPADDRTPEEQMGYRVTILEGELANDMIPDYDFRINGEVMYLNWSDGDTDDQEPIDLTIEIQAIDLAGNLGTRSDPITIQHPGSGGCSTAAHNTLEAWMCLLAVSLAVLRRKSRSG